MTERVYLQFPGVYGMIFDEIAGFPSDAGIPLSDETFDVAGTKGRNYHLTKYRIDNQEFLFEYPTPFEDKCLK